MDKNIVNEIFKLFYEGYPTYLIARMLNLAECEVVEIINPA